jgi:hypothetical protein
MLFDLRGRGRRRTVQAIYLSLAILMGGGLVLFGIGSNTSGGGLFDAVVGENSGGDSATSTLDKRIRTVYAKTRARPRETAAWAELARLRFQRAGIDGISADDLTYTKKGKARLTLATQAWERYLALDPKTPSAQVARLMVQAYGANGINQPVKAVRAMEIVTAAEKPPSSNLYSQLAQLAYQADDKRTGDLAADRAVELAPADKKKELRKALVGLRAQAGQPATTATGQGTPNPSG